VSGPANGGVRFIGVDQRSKVKIYEEVLKLTGKITDLARFLVENEPATQTREIRLIEGEGIEGDFHKGGDRQISVLSPDVWAWMDTTEIKGHCFDHYQENARIDGLALDTLNAGDRLSVGEAVMEISPAQKQCYDVCKLYSNGLPCRLAQNAKFAIVARGGRIKIGDEVSLSRKSL
jgi:MOSC domain-containing protein YiiM